MSDDVIRPGEMDSYSHGHHRRFGLGGPGLVEKAFLANMAKGPGNNPLWETFYKTKNDIVKNDYYNIGETKARVKEFVRRKFKWLPRPWLKVTNIIGNFVGHNFIRAWDASKGLDYTNPKNIEKVKLNELYRRK